MKNSFLSVSFGAQSGAPPGIYLHYALMPELTVEENVYLTSMVRNTPEKEYLAQTKEILTRIGLVQRSDALQSELSGGQQQRVSIARAVVNRPEILFADEPCANLDTESSKNVLDLFKQINTELKQTIVMVSHEEWHMEYFDRVIILRDGRVISNGLSIFLTTDGYDMVILE